MLHSFVLYNVIKMIIHLHCLELNLAYKNGILHHHPKFWKFSVFIIFCIFCNGEIKPLICFIPTTMDPSPLRVISLLPSATELIHAIIERYKLDTGDDGAILVGSTFHDIFIP